MVRFVWCCPLVLVFGLAHSHVQSPYMGQELRAIKSLSPQEISDYLSGKGMGLAKAAELNGYPGPAHVLELGVQVELTAEQKAKSDMLFQKMQSRAIAIGKELVEEERRLDKLFASQSVTVPLLASSLDRTEDFRANYGKYTWRHILNKRLYSPHIKLLSMATFEATSRAVGTVSMGIDAIEPSDDALRLLRF